ncbi:MAG: hypothetical protein IJ093_00005, partial [Bacilli bacterium]|nr:hypothetical protein [Bacilli bacterium]
PLKFNYEYNDKYGNLITLENITPQEFKKRYLTINLEDFVFIVSNPNLDYYKKYYKEFSSDNSIQPYLEFINLPKEILKSLTIKQLKNKMPVKFGCRIKIAPHSEINILDTRILDLQKLGIDLLDYQNGIKAKTITSEHGMTFEGVHLENEKPVRWKVENSHHKYSNQFFIMNDNYFDKNVITVNIHKSFLSKKQLEILKSKAIKVSNNEIT